MPTPEAKNTIKQTPEQIKQAQEATDRTKIKNAPAVKVAEKIKDTNIPQSKDIKDNAITPIKIENIKAQEVRKDTDLVIKRFPDLNTQVMRTILTQYHILKWDSGSQDAIGLDKLSLKQIYNLPMTTKANLAYLSSMIAHGPTVANYKKIAESDYMKQNKLSASAIANTIGRMNEGNPMGPSDLNFIRAFKSELEDIQQTEILQKFINMFPDGETVPPMPEIKQFAVGMGRTTWGLGGVENGSRWLFDYNNSAESPSLNSKNLEFGFDETKPMSISIIPSGSQSTKPSTINLLIKDQTGKTLGTVTGSYRRNESGRGNIFKLDSNPSLPDISVINNTINIPNTYKNASITLTAQAANIYGANYDEANFSLSIENGRTIDPTEKAHTGSVASYEEHITDPMELGKFELTPDAKVKISSIVDKSLGFGKLAPKEHIKLNLTIGADKTAFNEKGIDGTIKNYQTFIKTQKDVFVSQLKVFTTDQLDTMMKTLQPDESWGKPGMKQYDAQKALLDCRFLTTLGQIAQNQKMVDKIKIGKFDIVGKSSSEGKFITLKPETMSYIKG